MTVPLISLYDKETERRELKKKRKYNLRDCQFTLFSSSTELSSPTLPNII